MCIHTKTPAPVLFNPNVGAGVGSSFSSPNVAAVPAPSSGGSNVVTDAEQNAQEGRGSSN